MDETHRTRLGEVVKSTSGLLQGHMLIPRAVASALEFVPQPIAERSRAVGDSTVLEIVTDARLFTVEVSDQDGKVHVDITARRLDPDRVDVELHQRGKLETDRAWTFRFPDGDPMTLGRADEPFARALASRLGWGTAEPSED